MRKSAFCLAFLVLLINPSFGQDMAFEGTWEWVYTEYGNGDAESPSTVGYREQYYFGSGQTFVRYIDEQVVEQDLWYLGEVLIGACFVELLSVTTDTWYWWIEVNGVQTLKLQTGFECPDGAGGPPSKVATFYARTAVTTESNSWGGVKSLFR